MILVTGANGVVGTPLCDRLSDAGRFFLSVSRQPQSKSNSLVWDMQRAPDEDQQAQLSVVSSLIHCAPIWLLTEQLAVFTETRLTRLVVFSSTSVLSKQASSDNSEQSLVSKLAHAEEKISQFCRAQGWHLTILRPSMIYGYGKDQNVTHIARFIRRYGVMFLAGKASGKRQPVHADDLVNASLAVLENKSTYGKIYNLAGQEAFSYREMVERIFHGLNKKPKVVSLPVWSFRIGLRLASVFTGFSYTPEMADRMNQDLNYDCSAAINDFAYSPRPFLQNPAKDLGEPE